MYFKKLEIFGFKSFADKTTLHFGSGITAIIGPNGCGKSNVFDAIRWVLGEQSVKELRGSSMEDVIFNGTDKKPALGFAEVSLTFSNESKILPVDYSEVTVTRRLFRSGESEYLMNKAPVRLKDITELFLGTGIGAEAYSLVQQGRVDLVVSARPEDRRAILDEASGITKYKSKRKEALNKLDDTENNLLRINDIIVEVKRQISSLERQANKARRYKTEFEKLKNLEVRFANYKLDVFATQRQQLQDQLRGLKDRESEISGELEEFIRLVEYENAILEEVEENINEVRAENIKLDGRIDLNNRQIGFNEERIENLTFNQKRLLESKEQLIERCRIQQQKIEEVRACLSGLDVTLQNNLKVLDEKKAFLKRVIQEVSDAEEKIRREEEKILGITSEQVRVKNKLTESMKEVQGCLARKRRLEMENTKVAAEKEDVERKLSDISSKSLASLGRLAEMKNNLDMQRRVFDDLTKQLHGLDQEIDELEKKKLFLKSQKEFIEKLSVQYDDMPDPVIEGRLLTNVPPRSENQGLIGKIKETKIADPSRYGMLSSELAPGKPLYELVCETKFIELDPQQVSAKIEELNRRIGDMIVRREDMMSRIEEQRKMIRQMESDLQEEEKVLSVYEAQKHDVVGEVGKLSEELDLVLLELKETSETLVTLKGMEDELSFQLEQSNQDLSSCQRTIKGLQDFISRKSRQREETTVAIAQLETEIASIEDKRRGYQDNLTMFSETLDHHLEEIKRLDDERTGFDSKKEQFVKDIEDLQRKIEDLKTQKQSLGGILLNHERQKEEVAQKISALRNNISSFNEDIEGIKEKIHAEQMQEQEVAFKEKEIKDRLLQTYRIDLEEYNQQEKSAESGTEPSGEDVPEDLFDPEAMQIAVERLRKRCESFGAVNLVAIEEFDELRERFEFLTKQQSDLITAKESLHQTIRNINKQTRQMFMNTFTKVSEEFRIYFRMLFGGGEAQLVLLDPENVLESGIEIVARPPGKKLQNISLLSGGEKTLTAIALIFGVFKVNPSPFCVLDEIDAALDESNVGRYAYLLKDFAKIAQFIVITHNKKTIGNADVMYGITMQETGVSKVVSVKFEEREEIRQPEPAHEAEKAVLGV